MLDIIKDTLLDGAKLFVFLLLAFLIIEFVEHNLNNKSKKIIGKAGKLGPLLGSLLGMSPQCGFSVMATNLYVTRIVSLGTLIAIYLSTSDEMLPVLLSQNVAWLMIIKILGLKFIVGMLTGFLIDFFWRKRKTEQSDYEICEEEHCHCEKNIFISALIHSLKTFAFIILVSFGLNILIEYVGADYLAKIFLKDSFFGPFVTSLVGLIPNCAASVILTELYLNNAINFGSTMAGLLTGSGVAVLVLFKSNKNMKENLLIISLIYGIGVVSGLIIEIVEMII